MLSHLVSTLLPQLLTLFADLRFHSVHTGTRVAPQRAALRDYQYGEGGADGNDSDEFIHARSLATWLQ